MVYDQNEVLPGCDWTDKHSAQGFARRVSAVNFSTLIEFGYAEVTISQSAYELREDDMRVIAVPFRVTSGAVIVEGPEEIKPERNFALPTGDYRLVAAQRAVGEEEESIDLFFEQVENPMERSSVLVADNGLNPPESLLETAGIAGHK